MSDSQIPMFPFHSADPVSAPPEYAKLREQAPVSQVRLPSGDLAWLITRYEDVRMVMADPRFSREAITAPGAPRVLPIARGSKSIFVMDPPDHTRLRRLVGRAFAPRQISLLRPRIDELANELVKAMAAGQPPADLIAALAQPLPINVICEMLGVPYQDVPKFKAWTDLMLSFDQSNAEAVAEARDKLSDYLRALIADKQRQPTDDLLMVLVNATEDGDRLTEEELLAFGYTLLGAGYHATTAEIVHALIVLLRDPQEWQRLRAEPNLLPLAVDELLRRSQAGGGLGALRIAVEDVQVGPVLIRAGDAVLPSMHAANRDPSVFAEAERLDLARQPNPHVSFGYGIHHCLGAQLGRIELEIVLAALLRHTPNLRLAVPESELEWNRFVAFRRPRELPVTW
ncbi:MAG TPA: cytochrome P450 [Micromonosporaceae bacterium]